ncbi:tetratricopeptide repeat protein [Duganella sp. LjRoot269]|jgi:cytochrome c-type biogenesis protein CcmH|uniref:tetratricopeptide repeat protein n=1 Tax=Duganella sp. LjRoot269 TaxID=3342305 RepID=UPI003ECFBA53
MTGFILIATVMLACSLGFVLPVLLRREAGCGDGIPAPRQRWPLVLIAVAVPALAASLYAGIGNLKGLLPPLESVQADAAGAVGPEQIESMVTRLAQRLAKQPDDADGWRMLARSYETLRRFDQAADAYRHLLALEPQNPDLLVDYAVVLGMTLNRTLVGEPEALIGRALAIDPNHIQALALSGSAALERGDVASAVKPWKKILALVPADSDVGKSIAENIAKAQ